MWPTCLTDRGMASGAGGLRGAMLRSGFALALALTTASAFAPTIGAEPDTTDSQTAGASNGGIASATTTGGEVNIEQIITGENNGNSIVTGDTTGSSEIHGGDIAYPTDVTITLITGPQVADASGGDGGEVGSLPSGESGTSIVIDNTDTNKNDNRSSATISG